MMRSTLKTFFFVSLSLLLSSCGTSVNSSVASGVSSGSVCPSVDYVSQVHLALDYTGKNFLTDGIGKMSVAEYVDGDTTHFYMVDASGALDKSQVIASRYLCIDTPESTGQVQPWGKKASAFTDARIAAAKTIVVSSERSDYGPAAADSTGSRWLSYVWLGDTENCPYNQLKLLNLDIVQNGFSATKSATGTLYENAFFSADNQAQCQKIHIWSAKDPDYTYSNGTRTTIQEIMEGVKYNNETETYEAHSWADEKVSFDCTVAYSEQTGGDNAYVYDDLPSRSDSTKTIRYGIYCFAGYKSLYPLTRVGWRLNLVGYIQDRYGNLQMTSLKYSALYTGDDYITVLDKTGSTYAAPTITAKESQDPVYNNVVVQMNGLHGVSGSGTYASSDGSSMNVHCQDTNGDDTYLRFYKGVVKNRADKVTVIDSTTFEAYFCKRGETFNIYGPMASYTYESSGKTIHQIYILLDSNLVFNS